MSQISYRADPHFVVHCLDTLLPQFAVKPYQEDMLKLVNIFVLLREVFIFGFGPELRTEKNPARTNKFKVFSLLILGGFEECMNFHTLFF